MTYSIFSTLNESLLVNYSITTILFGIIAYLVLFFISYGIADIKAQRRHYNQLMDNIAHGLLTKKQLIEIARANSIKYSGFNKAALQSVLVYHLA